jgi:hypothetical protein
LPLAVDEDPDDVVARAGLGIDHTAAPIEKLASKCVFSGDSPATSERAGDKVWSPKLLSAGRIRPEGWNA